MCANRYRGGTGVILQNLQMVSITRGLGPFHAAPSPFLSHRLGQGRGRVPGCDRVDADAVGGPFTREVLCKLVDGGLGHCVNGARPLTEDRGEAVTGPPGV